MPPAVSRMRSNDNIPGVAAESVRSYAGVSLGTQDLYEALNAHPQQKERLIGWWNDPAPTLRDTLELLVMHVLPVAGGNARGLNTGWADRVGPVVESLVLNEVLASPALPASRSRARL